MYKDYFYFSLGFSIIIQILTGVFDIFALFMQVPLAANIIKQLLILELLVQVIEGSFYFWLFYNFNSITNVTPKRYLDWVITTPTMLVTLIIYLIYLNNKATSNLDFFQVFNHNFNTIISILFLNWLMLLFGYLGEINIIPTLLGVFLGFIPFLIYYYLIFINYVNYDNSGWKLFFYFFFFWSL
jgi:hypothetical protein